MGRPASSGSKYVYTMAPLSPTVKEATAKIVGGKVVRVNTKHLVDYVKDRSKPGSIDIARANRVQRSAFLNTKNKIVGFKAPKAYRSFSPQDRQKPLGTKFASETSSFAGSEHSFKVLHTVLNGISPLNPISNPKRLTTRDFVPIQDLLTVADAATFNPQDGGTYGGALLGRTTHRGKDAGPLLPFEISNTINNLSSWVDKYYSDSPTLHELTSEEMQKVDLQSVSQSRISDLEEPVPFTIVPTSTTNIFRPRTVAAGYDPTREVASIMFRDGTVVNYNNVPPRVWSSFKIAVSKGRWLRYTNDFNGEFRIVKSGVGAVPYSKKHSDRQKVLFSNKAMSKHRSTIYKMARTTQLTMGGYQNTRHTFGVTRLSKP